MPDLEHDSSMWMHLRERVFGPEHWSRAAPEALALLRLLQLHPAATILDLPCGTGRHSIELALLGLQVTGVDATAGYLSEARSRAQARGCDVEWVHEDMRHFRRPQAYDAALNLYTSFGYFEDAGEDRLVLNNLFDSLKPGGRLVIELSTRELLLKHLRPRVEIHLDDSSIIEEHELIHETRWLSRRVQVITREQRTELRFGRRLYSGEELQALLLSCGFQDLQVYGGLDGRGQDDTTELLVVVARRPGPVIGHG